MPVGLKRFQQNNDFHFITFSCYDRNPYLLSSESKDVVEEVLESTRRRYQWKLFGYVLMPEHIHLLTDEPADAPLAIALQVLKQITSRRLKPIKTTGSPQFWQRRYYDFNVRTNAAYIEKLRYIHRNPVKRGLVTTPEEYRWSSFQQYATGIIGTVTVSTRIAATTTRTTSP